jgi:hypothetical protein
MNMKGILKKTPAGWFVWYQVMKDEITSGYDSLPLHPDNEESLIEGKEVEFELVMDKPEHEYSLTPYAKTIDEVELGCSYPDCICQGDEITYCQNRTPEQVHLGHKTALVEWATNMIKTIDESWEEIEEEYLKDNYPVFGGPFTDALTPFEWLKLYFKSPKRLKN